MKPLEGIRVLEVASWLAAPCCAALMADMGAEVVKVEPPGGDTYRRLFADLLGDDFVHPSFQFGNRGKCGVAVDLEDPEALELVHGLARDADVFITNLTRQRLERYQLTDAHIHELAPTSIYSVLSGYGTTGEGQFVEVTLQRTGLWAMASDANAALYDRGQPEKTSRRAPGNPIWNVYPTADGRWLLLVMPMALPYWPRFCEMAGRPEWADDARFQTTLGLAQHGIEIVPEIEAMFASETLVHWQARLDAAGLIWEPVAEMPEVVEDPALRETGAFGLLVHPRAGAMEIVAAPFHVRGADIDIRGPAPDAGEHTREVFVEAGVDPAHIDALIERGALS